MVGYRNYHIYAVGDVTDFIRHSDGGVSEPRASLIVPQIGLYQAFRWWGIGTTSRSRKWTRRTLSGIPMVGYRNAIPMLIG